VSQLDCQSCGACCKATVPRHRSWICLIEADFEHVPIELTRKTHHYHDEWAMSLDASGCCVALEGAVGVHCACRIYDNRPRACRAFVLGSADCLLQRTIHIHQQDITDDALGAVMTGDASALM